jgi:endonuclease/exonuclease/phosphatase (EEP) superfamily protein YafD
MPARSLQCAVASGFAGWALARVAAVDRIPTLDGPVPSLLSFTPQVAVGAWLSALLLTDDRAAAISAVAAGAMTAVVLPRAVPRRQPAATGPVLSVLTANVLVGRASAEPLVDLARRTGADVLFVQEITAELVARLALAGLADVLPHMVNDLDAGGSRGNGIYARYPLTPVPAPVRRSWARPVATLDLPARPVRLVCVHLHAPIPRWPMRGVPGVPEWRDELAALPTAAGPGGLPVVFAGDFNSTVDHAPFRRLLRRGYADAASQAGTGLRPTWGPAPGGQHAVLTIDHILTDQRSAVLATSVHPLAGTDHRAVFAKIRLPD